MNTETESSEILHVETTGSIAAGGTTQPQCEVELRMVPVIDGANLERRMIEWADERLTGGVELRHERWLTLVSGDPEGLRWTNDTSDYAKRQAVP